MKVLKVAAIVIGAAALIATGVGVAAGLSVGASFAGVAGATAGLLGVSGTLVGSILLGAIGIAVTSGLEAVIPKPSSTSGTQTKWKPDPYAGNPYLMGRTLAGGNIVLRRGHGANNMYETFVTILTICTAASIDTTFLNKTTTAFDGGGAAIGTYSGQVWQRQQLGLCPEPAALISPVGNPAGWTGQHKLSGLAATVLTFKYDTRTTNGLTTEPSPAWIGHWVKVYDPRLDSTYPGGSGPCRAYDEETYVWSENPHLHGLTWAMGRYQNGKRVAGIGTGAPVAGGTVKGVDVASFVEGANLDDARRWTIGGQVNTRPDTLWNSLKSMLQAGGARPALIGGVITSINRAPRVSLATITRDDIVGKCTFAGTQPRRSRLNGIIPQYRSEAHDWEMVSAGEVSVADFVALDGDERTKEISYPLVQDVDQVAQLAGYDLYDLREAGPGSVPLKPWWLNYKVGDCVTFAPEAGLSIKTLITGRAIEAQSGVVTYTVRGETDGKHNFALNRTGNAPPIVSLAYDTRVGVPSRSDWQLTPATQTVNGNAVPVLLLSGAITNPNAEAIIVEVAEIPSADGAAPVSDTAAPDWRADSVLPPATTSKVISGIVSTGVYRVAVSYRVRGVQGDRLLLGPVTAGQLVISGVATTDDIASINTTMTQQSAVIAEQAAKTVAAEAAAESVNLFTIVPTDIIPGIIAGTDTTDLAPYITAALAGASRKVTLGPGVFNTTNTASLIRAYQMLDGAGKRLTRLNIISDTKPAVYLTNGVEGFSVRNMTITRELSQGGSPGPAAHGVQFEGSTDKSVLEELKIDGHFHGAFVGTCDEGLIRSVEIINSIGHNLFQTCSANYGQSQWHIENVLFAQAGGDGHRIQSVPGSPGMILGRMSQIRTFANSGRGIHAIGSAATPIFDIGILGAFLGSDGMGGARFDTYGHSHSMQAFVERAGADPTGPGLNTAAPGQGAGVEITANNVDFDLSGRMKGNTLDGVFHNGGMLTMNGCLVIDNGQSRTAGRRNGVLSQGGVLCVTGGRIMNDTVMTPQGPVTNTTQLFGIASSHDNVNLVGIRMPPDGGQSALYLPVTTNAVVYGISPPGIAPNYP